MSPLDPRDHHALRAEALEHVYNCAMEVLYGYPVSKGPHYDPYREMRYACAEVWSLDHPDFPEDLEGDR